MDWLCFYIINQDVGHTMKVISHDDVVQRVCSLQDGVVHASLEPAQILYLTIAYDWFLFG